MFYSARRAIWGQLNLRGVRLGILVLAPLLLGPTSGIVDLPPNFVVRNVDGKLRDYRNKSWTMTEEWFEFFVLRSLIAWACLAVTTFDHPHKSRFAVQYLCWFGNGDESSGNRKSTGDMMLQNFDCESVDMDESQSSLASTSSHFSRGTSLGSGNINSEENVDDKLKVAAEDDDKLIGRLRCFTLAVIVTAGVAVSLSIYFTLTAQQVASFDNKYSIQAESILEAYATQHFKTLEALQALSDTTTSLASSLNQSFPFVTLRGTWDVAARHALQESRAEGLFYMPSVSNVSSWNKYSERQNWWSESVRYAREADWLEHPEMYNISETVRNPMYRLENREWTPVTEGGSEHLPIWMTSPPPLNPGLLNMDMISLPGFEHSFHAMTTLGAPLYTEVLDLSTLLQGSAAFKSHSAATNSTLESTSDLPHSILLFPVKNGRSKEVPGELVGVLAAVLSWDQLIANALPENDLELICVLENSCGQAYTYQMNGSKPLLLGEGDLHDHRFDSTRTTSQLQSWNASDVNRDSCTFRLQVYTVSDTVSNAPAIYATAIGCTFLLVLVTVAVYDLVVQQRQSRIVQAALRSHAMIASLFPSNVRARLFEGGSADPKVSPFTVAGKAKPNTIKGFLSSEDKDDGDGYDGKPIADLFPETTILFADIAGFTAWSSVREPTQVFTLLETLYSAFDAIAHRRRVFKVETVGDCYVAATGLPEARKDHAVVMARFAKECMTQMQIITKRLEVSLGPDTGDLHLRVGLHSGPVTAGVLRGERSRFQLFGDTMNTASRMETTGIKGMIHISEDTAELLRAAGKERWIRRRAEKVVAKGKGEMQTYFLSMSYSGKGSTTDGSTIGSDKDLEEFGTANLPVNVSDERMSRLVEWNVEVLLRYLKQVEARRQLLIKRNPHRKADADEGAVETDTHMVIDEVREIITLPDENFSELIKGSEQHVTLHPAVCDELKDYVTNIAALYNDNPFHNYEHASHVAMSVVKLLSRIVAPSEDECGDGGKTLHDHTYGITSDPLTQFACVLAALIHDVDHQGVPNSQLIREHTHLAHHYKEKSIAEQNSMDLAWKLLMDDSYRNLRRAIYTTKAGLTRFRQLLVNSVMATDIFDAELKALRNARWATAFSEERRHEDARDAQNRKATIVIEHLIQASDVSHTMQHWHIYRKWNERYFVECYKAFKEGRADKDPSEGWYQGEIGFFDFYIIPLARKLKDCGVFGVSSDEYLNYAVRNRREWEERGREVVDEMVQLVSGMPWSQAHPIAAASPSS